MSEVSHENVRQAAFDQIATELRHLADDLRVLGLFREAGLVDDAARGVDNAANSEAK